MDAIRATWMAMALAAADAWLQGIDAGRYAESWDEAAALFRGAVTQEQWEQALRGVRGPLGKLASRKVRSAHCARSLPGAPDGEYVVIQYDAAYENKREAVETVTPMREKDGAWRVSGYFVK
jgi:hypothetical protein